MREIHVFEHAAFAIWQVGDGITEAELLASTIAACHDDVVASMNVQAVAEHGQFDPADIRWILHPARPGFEDPPGARVLAASVSLDL